MNANQQQNYSNAPFTSTFLLGLLGKPILCKPLIQKAINKLTQTFSTMHPNVITRMSEFAPAIMILNPIDLPVSFLVEFSKTNMNILLIDDNKYSGHDITRISASFAFFLNMLEGEIDGDALFFSRQLTIEGDTTIVVALRNILEAESININDDINDQFFVFAGIIRFIKNITNSIMYYVDADLDKIKKSIIYNTQTEMNMHKSIQDKIYEEMKNLEKKHNLLENKVKSMRLKINKDKS